MAKLLEQINDPDDLKLLSLTQLDKLAVELREFIINNVSLTGGHLASNLGVIELTLALHYHLYSPDDKIVWDVGHQTYAHKIITGRKEKFSSLRQKGGLSGYLKYSESVHDIIEAGHTSTSISSALGLALARDFNKRNDRIYAVIGDGALTGGMAFEALNHAGHLQRDINVILNDNEMSISSNIGALSHYLSNIRTDPTVSRLKEDLEFLVNRIPGIGSIVSKTAERVKNGLKYVFISGILFEELGFTYIGPLDGHNIKELIENFKKADRVQGPVLIHINTKKGKGYLPAEKKPTQYHSVKPFNISNGESKKHKQNLTFSQVFGQTMVKMGKKDEKIVGITAAMSEGTCLDIFAEEFPERTFDVGIAEQHAVTLGAGMARGSMKPVVVIYSTFLQRAVDQIVQDVCMQNLPVTLSIDRAGIVGHDGETHQGVFDIAYLRMIPNMIVMAPADENELQHMLLTAVNYPGPAAVRYPRGQGQGVKLDKELHNIAIGKAQLLRKGSDILIIAIGSPVYYALAAADISQQKGISVGVINARFIKPLDRDLLIKEIKRYKRIITVEEHVLAGGFGSAILELINENNIKDVSLKRLGLPDEFILHGETETIRNDYGLDTSGIVSAVEEMMEKDVGVGYGSKATSG